MLRALLGACADETRSQGSFDAGEGREGLRQAQENRCRGRRRSRLALVRFFRCPGCLEQRVNSQHTRGDPGCWRIIAWRHMARPQPRGGVQMRSLVQLLLAFVAGFALGYLLLSIWDVIAPHLGALDPFDTRYGRW